MKILELKIEGMHCEGCSNRLEKILNNIEGVQNAEVILDSKKAIIELNEEADLKETIKEAIIDAGFEVVE